MKVRCLHCKNETSHESIAKHATSGEISDGFQWWTDYEILKCRGCGTVSFLQRSWDESDYFGGNEHTVNDVLYPSRTTGRQAIFDDFVNPEIPESVLKIYLEVIAALNNSLPLLAAIGLRAIIEAICQEQKCVGKDLEQRINDLATKGVLAKQQAHILHSHRFLGNIAAHEIVAPESLELLAAFDIAETMLKTIYVLPKLHKTIKTGKKPRPSAQATMTSTTPKVTP